MNRTRLVLVTIGLVGAITAVPGEAAAAGSTDLVTCIGSAEQTYDPGLTLVTRDTHISSTLTFSNCIDASSGSHQPVTSAVITVDYITPVSCLVSPPVTETSVDIDWSGNEKSTADVTVVVNRPSCGGRSQRDAGRRACLSHPGLVWKASPWS